MKPSRTQDSERGFTLLEVLVALTILAIAAAGLMSAVQLNLRQQESLEIKTFALWIAQNRLAELHAARAWPEVGESSDTISMADRQWKVHVTFDATANADIRRARVDVAPEAEAKDAPSTVSLTGFLGRQ